MTRPPPLARTRRRIRWVLGVGLVAVLAAIIVVLTHHVPTSSSFSAVSPQRPSSAASPNGSRGELRGVPGEAEGVVPDGVTVFDEAIPAVVNLDPALLDALRQAAAGAADDAGVVFYVNSGWRSPEYQNHLLQQAIAEYGSEDEAARWVATAETSPHVSGDAVDLGRSDATAWLSEHGAAYGLCRIYGNEPWHFELRTDAIDHGCPPLYDDPTQDPRMQQ
ncbi:D,D-carboxypeptidase [Streptomyces davaonensis JCM 4913]|uniref:D,D-carboxypeptidase n=1 Tax=Streptomyces davaonensis (strain DSM 101723 / JCM 4913 / KCC S-0913 / 768) TaxID=1214101 RepID=K4QVK7_STRDJ|nr:M15 family metallopeptidase [Streptomyces davaonensis]CCK24972.1 D,D-carboxypeptidase [Streptomyces davaonensis JCM 4913]